MLKIISNKNLKRGRPNSKGVIISKLKKKGIFSLNDARKLGISQPTLSRLVAGGEITRVARGQYIHSNSNINRETLDFVLACEKFGKKAAIAGMSALAHYGLIEEVPRRIWITVPPDVKSTDTLYRCLRTTTNPKIGIINHNNYRITNLERTIIEAFRYSSKLGLNVAIKAARTAINNRLTTETKLLKEAQKLGLEKYILKQWEAITS